MDEFKALLMAAVTEALSAEEGICGIVMLGLILGVGGVVFGVGSPEISPSFVVLAVEIV